MNGRPVRNVVLTLAVFRNYVELSDKTGVCYVWKQGRQSGCRHILISTYTLHLRQSLNGDLNGSNSIKPAS